VELLIDNALVASDSFPVVIENGAYFSLDDRIKAVV
jgi:hypothetical protein